MSMAAISVLGPGLGWLKPSVMFCVRLVRSVRIECCGLKPCCVGEMGMWGLKLLRISLSSILMDCRGGRSGGRRLAHWGACRF